ncbi:anti-sigma regulatory factor [Pseudonocardia sulfidoxydans NBRC 16205]|uniref:Anti-sigma regulatory factor n=1 Tax=Pseudonocardia sulfidoxydans NBRC 16205 TaxID=1223511 RepID=A0A511DQB5_9PSEU|nr:ATP-binding protein [Pseudonocardia sulfidoxydans]GEL26433.1 anti-sigma regulatory factor [Pseudonocardia sulfidoxydans NBRC 16205]
MRPGVLATPAGPTMTAPGAGVAEPLHEGVPFSSPTGLAAQLGPRLRSAIEAEGPVVAVLADPERDAVRAELGDAAGRVEFLSPAEVYRLPAFTVAVRWARLSRRTVPGGCAAVVAQHVADLPDGPGYWARLDAALDVALPGLPVEVLCPFPDDVEERLLRGSTHRTLLSAGHSVPGLGYRTPGDVVAEFPPPPPPDLGRPVEARDFALDGLSGLRRAVAEVSTDAGLSTERVADFVLAVNEIASNSVEHGPGSGTLRLWQHGTGPGSHVVAEVRDGGRMQVPFPGLVAPPPSGARGRGLWLASELSDVLQVWSDGSGTVIRVTMSL